MEAQHLGQNHENHKTTTTKPPKPQNHKTTTTKPLRTKPPKTSTAPMGLRAFPPTEVEGLVSPGGSISFNNPHCLEMNKALTKHAAANPFSHPSSTTSHGSQKVSVARPKVSKAKP
jgi:hypothetical protein